MQCHVLPSLLKGLMTVGVAFSRDVSVFGRRIVISPWYIIRGRP